MIVLVRYFLFMSNPSKKDANEVIGYIKKNTVSNYYFLFKITIMYITYKPYGVLKPIAKKIIGK